MGSQFNSFRNQMSISFNMLFSMVATFGMGFYICKQLEMPHNQVCCETMHTANDITDVNYIEYDGWISCGNRYYDS